MNIDNSALTDDELVALAFDQSRPWPTPLPTVDVADQEALAGAALRGLRSLALRGGLRDGEFSSSLTEIAEATTARPGLLLHRGDEKGEIDISVMFGVAVVALPRGWLIDEISVTGMHLLREVDDRRVLLDFLTDLLTRNALAGDGGGGHTTCLTFWEQLSSSTLMAAQAGAVEVRRDPDPVFAPVIGTITSWVEDALERTAYARP